MKNKLSFLLKRVFLSSIAGVLAKESHGALNTIKASTSENNVDNTVLFEKSINLQPKLLLKKITNEEWNVMAHRSHRSHSSHRSHYSSSAGSSSSTSRSSGSSTSSRSTGTSSSSNSNTSTSSTTTNINTFKSGSNVASSSTTNSGITATALTFGSRILKRGMSGSDVTELINILIKKGYLKLENGETEVTGSYNYDETIEATVKKYQSDNKLAEDGVCGVLTIYYLKDNKK